MFSTLVNEFSYPFISVFHHTYKCFPHTCKFFLHTYKSWPQLIIPPRLGLQKCVKLPDEHGCHFYMKKIFPGSNSPSAKFFGRGGDLNPGPSGYWTGALVNWSTKAWLEIVDIKTLFILLIEIDKKKYGRGVRHALWHMPRITRLNLLCSRKNV